MTQIKKGVHFNAVIPLSRLDSKLAASALAHVLVNGPAAEYPHANPEDETRDEQLAKALGAALLRQAKLSSGNAEQFPDLSRSGFSCGLDKQAYGDRFVLFGRNVEIPGAIQCAGAMVAVLLNEFDIPDPVCFTWRGKDLGGAVYCHRDLGHEVLDVADWIRNYGCDVDVVREAVDMPDVRDMGHVYQNGDVSNEILYTLMPNRTDVRIERDGVVCYTGPVLDILLAEPFDEDKMPPEVMGDWLYYYAASLDRDLRRAFGGLFRNVAGLATHGVGPHEPELRRFESLGNRYEVSLSGEEPPRVRVSVNDREIYEGAARALVSAREWPVDGTLPIDCYTHDAICDAGRQVAEESWEKADDPEGGVRRLYDISDEYELVASREKSGVIHLVCNGESLYDGPMDALFLDRDSDYANLLGDKVSLDTAPREIISQWIGDLRKQQRARSDRAWGNGPGMN